MHPHIQKLYSIAIKRKKNYRFNEGTSVDGLDIALCTISGSGTDTRSRSNKFETVSHTMMIFKNESKVSVFKKAG
jgi:anhydro-N-acetylmuramic acid kinase